MNAERAAVRSEPASPPRPAPETPTVDAAHLFGSGREIVIVHNGERYRLRLTANNKLILTK